MIWWMGALTVLTVLNTVGVVMVWWENGTLATGQRVLYKMVVPLYQLGLIKIVDNQAHAQPKLSVVPKPTEDK